MILEAKRQLRVALFSEAGIDLTPADARRVSTKELLDTAGAANGGGAEEKPAATVSVAAWARVMGECLKLALPWARLQPLLAPAAADGAIDVDGFLGRYRARAPKGAAAAAPSTSSCSSRTARCSSGSSSASTSTAPAASRPTPSAASSR